MKENKNVITGKAIPAHVAIIMDGNGRWAKQHFLPRIEGHRRGAEVIEPIIDAAMDLGVKVLSLYAFSTENWIRPMKEIDGLWKLLDYFFNAKMALIQSKGIRIKHSGSLKKLPPSIKKTVGNAVRSTKNNSGIILNFCLNYGGRQEIVDAVNSWLKKKNGNEKITLKNLEKFLYTSDLPDVDLMIRTGGEFRISNFLLWQMAYSELVFMDVLWPDFKKEHLVQAIRKFQQRERRFGGI
jgi:undecaprenyl diphosphate synthase